MGAKAYRPVAAGSVAGAFGPLSQVGGWFRVDCLSRCRWRLTRVAYFARWWNSGRWSRQFLNLVPAQAIVIWLRQGAADLDPALGGEPRERALTRRPTTREQPRPRTARGRGQLDARQPGLPTNQAARLLQPYEGCSRSAATPARLLQSNEGCHPHACCSLRSIAAVARRLPPPSAAPASPAKPKLLQISPFQNRRCCGLSLSPLESRKATTAAVSRSRPFQSRQDTAAVTSRFSSVSLGQAGRFGGCSRSLSSRKVHVRRSLSRLARESWIEVSHTLAKPDQDRRSSHDTGTGEAGARCASTSNGRQTNPVASGSENTDRSPPGSSGRV